MAWINLDGLRFDRRECVLTVSARHDFSVGIQLAELLKERPEPVEMYVRQLIQEARPELVGCSIYWLDFNACTRLFEIGIAHASLKPVADGCSAQREPLFNNPIEGASPCSGAKDDWSAVMYPAGYTVKAGDVIHTEDGLAGVALPDEPQSWRDKEPLL